MQRKLKNMVKCSLLAYKINDSCNKRARTQYLLLNKICQCNEPATKSWFFRKCIHGSFHDVIDQNGGKLSVLLLLLLLLLILHVNNFALHLRKQPLLLINSCEALPQKNFNETKFQMTEMQIRLSK